MRGLTLATVSMLALGASGALAQTDAATPLTAPAQGGSVAASAPAPSADQGQAAAPSGEAAVAASRADDRDRAQAGGAGEIIVTATRRASRLSDVPVAVQAVTPQQLQNTGATDIRQLTQIAPSLLVSSTSSEAGAGGARIRGIGTVGDNPGLESSVATFIDGVYRSRAGVALTELGPIEQVEVLRGPQGTLFGRNASAGLLNITTARPNTKSFGGFFDGSYGNYNFYRLAGGVTGPIGDSGLSFRLDGVYNHRDGFIKDVVSDRRFNNRNRYLIRGKLLYQPSDDFSILLIGDYTHQNEQCCAATYLPASDVTRAPDGHLVFTPSTVAGVVRGLTSLVPGSGQGQIVDDTFGRRVAVTPGRSYLSRVNDWGGSAQVDATIGSAKLTSITAYRYNKYTSGYDSDYNNLDILAFPDNGDRFTRFKTFSQELRLQGSLFADKLDWLLGGYYSHEKLTVTSNLTFGADYDQYATAFSAALLGQVNPLLGAVFPLFGGYQGLQTFSGAVAGVLGGPAAGAAVGSAVSNLGSFVGAHEADRFSQTDNNYALFTHNIFHVADNLSVTLGARYTWDNKSLDANLGGASPCNTFVGDIAALNNLADTSADPGTRGAAGLIATSILLPLTPIACLINGDNGQYSGKRREHELTGNAVLTYKPTDRLLTYASYSRGYKAGGFNLDRATLLSLRTATYRDTTNLGLLQFKPEKVDSFEVGTKYRGRGFDINIAGFYEMFKTFQLNTFDGTHFFVTDIRGCKDDLGGTDRDQIYDNSQCNKFKPGVTSRGVEIETYLYPARDVTFNMGFTLSDTKYAKALVGTPDEFGNNSLDPSLSLIPGARVSNSSLYTVTGSGQWTPPLGERLRALVYADFRFQSDINTGSDNFAEKRQPGVMLVNGRVGIGDAHDRWRIEGWVQNAFNVNYTQVAFNAPLQGTGAGSSARLTAGQTSPNLYAAFLAEPRTFGMTVRTKF